MAASQDWICVRLATYESQEEAEFLQKFFGSRVLPNTTFMLLSPTGETLTRTHRGPGTLTGRGDDGDLAQRLKSVAKDYKPTGVPELLPQGLDFRRALNVASCDQQPLIAIVAPKGAKRDAIEKQLARIAWDTRFIGRAQYIVTDDVKQLDAVDADGMPGILMIEPGKFGLTGRVTSRLALGSSPSAIAKEMDAFLDGFSPPAKGRDHVRDGKRAGIKWQTEIKQTDGRAYKKEQGNTGRKRRGD